MKKKRFMTLLEIMIVIFLISLIGGVIGYNMKGSLEKGKAFKTEMAKKQIEDILLLEHAQGDQSLDYISENAEEFLRNSGLVKNEKELIKDGWGEKFQIKTNEQQDGFEIISEREQIYKSKKK